MSKSLLEREREVEQVGDALDLVAAGTGRLVVVEGVAGVGKTVLVHVALDEARARGSVPCPVMA